MSLDEARRRLTELVNEIERRHEHAVITRDGRSAVIVMSANEYEALQESLDVLDDPETLDALRESEEDVRAGRLFSLTEVKRDLGLI